MRTTIRMLACIALVLAGCSKGEVTSGADTVAEVTARNVASVAGVAAFEHEGVDVDGNLACRANASGGVATVAIACTGSADDGSRLRMDGTVTSLEDGGRGGLQGSFTGFVDGRRVFATHCLGIGC